MEISKEISGDISIKSAQKLNHARKLGKIVLTLGFYFLSPPVQAEQPFINHESFLAAEGEPQQDDVYFFQDEAAPEVSSFSGPEQIFEQAYKAASETMKKSSINLLDWMLLKKKWTLPTERYQRVLQFGRWINDPTDDTCMNTRAQVLVRDSKTDVSYRNTNRCTVASGQWNDLYGGEDLFHASQVQIDHVVPLKHAYVAGAWKWDYKTRCLYANFMGAKYHLLPVGAHENMSKGDKSPDAYIPPNEGARCEYLQSWLKIKATWNLVINKSEAEGIQKLIKDNHCQPADFKMSTREIDELRGYIQGQMDYCANHKR